MSLHHIIDFKEGHPLPSNDNSKHHPPTGISCLVVGAGVGGLMTAMECWRRGHTVQVVERSPSPSTAGDFFSIGRNIIRHFWNHWPDLAAECDRINYSGLVAYHKLPGERISGPEPVALGEPMMTTLNDGSKKLIPFNRHHRPKFVTAMLAQVQRLGIPVTFGTKVADYFESPDGMKAGVVLGDGQKVEADLVVAADGIGTKSGEVIGGGDVRASSSGLSIFRTSFPVELALADPLVRERWPLLEGDVPCLEIWGGDNMAFFVQRYKDIMCWLLTHKSDGKGMESWNHSVDTSQVLKVTSAIDGFPEVAQRLIKTTPHDGIIDWEIMWRDPKENWVSPGGRIVQVGDSAHTFLPSSGSGATQALEDAISLGACLELCGRGHVPLGTKVHNKLRFERVSCIQLCGFMNHQKQSNPVREPQNTDEEDESFKVSLGNWQVLHDPEKYARERYDQAVDHLSSGGPFKSTNIPPGYTYEKWTISDLLGKIEKGEKVRFDGDWS